MFRQDLRNVTRNRVGSSGSNFPVDSRQLILGQADCDLRPGHTSIIPLVNGRYKRSAATGCGTSAQSKRFAPRSGQRGRAAGPLMNAGSPHPNRRHLFPRTRPLSFSKTVVLRYRIHLESRHLAPGTINLRLGAVRRLAYEASDCGLLSPDLAAGIRRVRGVKKIGVRLGNWLTPEQSHRLWNSPDFQRLKGKRDRALLAVLLACGLRRHEAVNLDFGHIQQREEHRASVDLKGKAGHTRTYRCPTGSRLCSMNGFRPAS